eukprot:CAMPEP_0202859122 /NCGR_PEP_ID=MMETSP1391-20130828/1378_1 /ASSEMBLY_ACC=CAM_ASM_000867 /TAXON_ID=1034604 /ORGANISM="Chlamydomonas leiostraca, Strain SAG 11-49" /LENGTH=803 /DNA_ID=CAMNT_0049538131 /DNA_START=139 /DNA_END=2550 /DNA_ORIENTATION=+
MQGTIKKSSLSEEGRRQSQDVENISLLGTEYENSNIRRGSVDIRRGSVGFPGTTDEDLGATYQAPDSGPAKKPKYIIMPSSRFRYIWVQVTLVVALYIIWVTPIRVGFNMSAQGGWFWIEGVIDIFFYTDLVLNFFTAYEHPVTSEVITSHTRIAKRYLSSWFWIDLLATFPSDYIVKALEGTWGCSFSNTCGTIVPNDTAVSIIVLMRTMRIFRIIWIFKNFNVLSVNTVIGRWMDEFITVRWLFSIAELLVVLIFLGHLCGCFFYMFSHPAWQTPAEKKLIADGELSTWVLDKLGAYNVIEVPTVWPEGAYVNGTVVGDQFGLDKTTGIWYQCPDFFYMYDCPKCQGPKLRCRSYFGFSFRYITSMYWAYTTMTTVGYGDICGTTIAEKVWAMCTMVIGGFFLSFCFGRIASVVSKLDADRAARSEQMENVSQFLRDTELPKALSRKVLDFFNSNFKGFKPYDRGAVLNRMPFDLRSKILKHLYLDVIKNVPVLHKIAVDDEIFLTDFTLRLQPYHTSSDTFIYQRGEINADVYILVRGDLHVMDIDRRTPLFKIPEGTIFGEAAAIRKIDGTSKCKRTESVFCSTSCDMLRLPHDDLAELSDIYPPLLKGLRRLDKARQIRLQTIMSVHGGLATANGSPGPAGTVGNTLTNPLITSLQRRSLHRNSLRGGSMPGAPEQMLPDISDAAHLPSTTSNAGAGLAVGPPNLVRRSPQEPPMPPTASRQVEALAEEVAALKTLLQHLPAQIAAAAGGATAGTAAPASAGSLGLPQLPPGSIGGSVGAAISRDSSMSLGADKYGLM